MRLKTLLIGLVILCQSCIDLKTINTYSNAASGTIKSIAELPYSFTNSYKTIAFANQLLSFRQGEIDSNRIRLTPVAIDSNTLLVMQGADKTIILLSNTLRAYFEGISKLSGKAINYDFESVGNSIKSSAQIKAITGTSNDEIDAALQISTVATNTIMGRYRERKLRQTIIKYDVDVSKTIDALTRALNLLIHNLDADEGLLQARYQLIMANPGLPIANKAGWKKEYYNELSELEKRRALITTQIQALNKMKQAHNDIATQLANKKLSSKDIIKLLMQYSGDIYSLYSEIQVLTK